MSSYKAGYVAIIGRPNVGKSTLLNHLVGEKISIVSRKAQTTRHRLLGILTQDQTQYMFVDTPGFQKKYTNALNQTMNRQVTSALVGVDVIVLVVEASRADLKDAAVTQPLIQLLPTNNDIPVILVINKIDQLKDKTRLLPMLSGFSALYNFAAIVPTSGEKEIQLTELLAEIAKHLPEQAALFDEDEMTDKSERFLAAEFIREKLFHLLGDELPYTATVDIEKFEIEGGSNSNAESGGESNNAPIKTRSELRHIQAAIIVDRQTHKGIVIGKGGETLKRIASEARQDMERLFDGKVFLEVFVKVKSGWADDERLLKTLGYE